jgi:hypothetical protein
VPAIKAPYYPIIYVRGYAMTRGEIEQTTADPFCGFNLGSTVYRAVADKDQKPRKYVFESPVVRLAEFGYSDVYEDGYDIVDPEWEVAADGKPTDNALTGRSIVIYRYYDPASTLLGGGASMLGVSMSLAGFLHTSSRTRATRVGTEGLSLLSGGAFDGWAGVSGFPTEPGAGPRQHACSRRQVFHLRHTA